MNQTVGRSVSILYRKYQVYLNKALKPLMLTGAELPFLMVLFQKEGVSQDELSHYLMIDKAATARALQSLIEKGYIYKEKDSLDKRANQIYLLDLAKDNQKAILRVLEYWHQYLLEGIDKDKVDLFMNVLDFMTNKVLKMDFSTIGGNEDGKE